VIQAERIKLLNDRPERPSARYVLYWMQQAQRASGNHALEFAIREANRRQLPVVTVFGLTQRFPGAQLRHYAFMLEGLVEAEAALRKRGIRLIVRLEPPPRAVAALAGGASLVVTDRGYLRIQRRWRERVAERLDCRVVQVESDVVVPVDLVSSKEEYAARTIRPKILRHRSRFLTPLEETNPARSSVGLRLGGEKLGTAEALLKRLRVARRATRVATFQGGQSEATRHLRSFLKASLPRYADEHNNPGRACVSRLSPYLHFGHISPLDVALAVRSTRGVAAANKDGFLEELIVRRELAMNFCRFNDHYDNYECLPEWARRTLAQHARDRRDYLYSPQQLESAATHDPYWNAAQREMVETGTMHGYMRMYWGKKIIEWTPKPEGAFGIAIALNNTYQLDGRDPNSFAGVAWCFGKHDRPWKEREVFGQVRWMSAAGLERKFDMNAYVEYVERASAKGEVRM
jgi:deoxyribodipyrimidine photo-lyase